MPNTKPLGAIFDIVPVIVPVDLQAAQSGDWISLKGYQGVAFVMFKGVGSATEVPTLTFRQATSVGGGSAKDLAVVTTIHKKEGAALTAVGSWTAVTQAAAATFAPAATSQGVYVVQIDAAELDVDNDFDCVTVNSADAGIAAQLGCVFAILYGLRYGGAVTSLGSAIAD